MESIGKGIRGGGLMLEIHNTEVFGLERAIKASGNPMSQGAINTIGNINDKDFQRATRLGKASQNSGHDNYLSGITVMFSVKYPQYWTPEFQRYHFIQIISSQSTMHRLTTMGKDFDTFKDMFNKYVDITCIKYVYNLIQEYNYEPEDHTEKRYELFMKIISNLPRGFEMWMDVTTNYLQLKTIYNQRKNHKLREDWGAFCDWILTLPKFRELTGV